MLISRVVCDRCKDEKRPAKQLHIKLDSYTDAAGSRDYHQAQVDLCLDCAAHLINMYLDGERKKCEAFFAQLVKVQYV
jgi:hypothetical protein